MIDTIWFFGVIIVLKSFAGNNFVVLFLCDSVGNSEPEKAQMTIFYNGQVMVFNDFPADKVKEIMLLAGKGTSPNVVNTFTATNMVTKPAESAASIVPSFANNLVQETAQGPPQPNVNGNSTFLGS